MPGIPLSVWEEIPTVVVFTVLILVIGRLFLVEFRKSVSKIEDSHLESIKLLNKQYVEIINVFDRRWEEQTVQINKVNDAIVTKLERLTTTIDQVNRSVRRLNNRFEEHDAAERQQLEHIEAGMDAGNEPHEPNGAVPRTLE